MKKGILKSLKIILYLIILINFILIGYLRESIANPPKIELVNISRVIDGDSLALDDGRKVRLLGINTPEKGMILYDKATKFLKELGGKEVKIESIGEDKDKYGRLLRYVFYQDKLFNEEILKHGLGNFYSYSKDKYTPRLLESEEYAREQQLGIWKSSPNLGCIELVELKFEENTRCKNQEKIFLNNKCKKIQVLLKDDATNIYKIELDNGIFTKNFSCVWNNEGDSVYIWDSEGMVLFYRY